MTPQQQADLLLSEYHANRRLNMSLEDWDQQIRPHLHFIEAGAEMAARHARVLPMRPRYETKAQLELEHTRHVLETALDNVNMALAVYEQKKIGE